MEMGNLRDNLNTIFGVRGTDSHDVMVRSLDVFDPFGRPDVVDPEVRYEPYGNSIHSDLENVCKRRPHTRRP
jgi:hypothetical protein